MDKSSDIINSVIKGESLCKYKSIFGEPNTGVHATRLFDFAINDIIATFAGALLFSLIYNYYMTSKIEYNQTYFIKASIGLLLLGIIIHKLFCVDTKLNKLLGL